eukprot:ctg_2582.g448
MLDGVLRAPYAWYLRVLKSRVLSRFARDLDVVESMLPQSMELLAWAVGCYVAFLVLVTQRAAPPRRPQPAAAARLGQHPHGVALARGGYRHEHHPSVPGGAAFPAQAGADGGRGQPHVRSGARGRPLVATDAGDQQCAVGDEHRVVRVGRADSLPHCHQRERSGVRAVSGAAGRVAVQLGRAHDRRDQYAPVCVAALFGGDGVAPGGRDGGESTPSAHVAGGVDGTGLAVGRRYPGARLARGASGRRRAVARRVVVHRGGYAGGCGAARIARRPLAPAAGVVPLCAAIARQRADRQARYRQRAGAVVAAAARVSAGRPETVQRQLALQSGPAGPVQRRAVVERAARLRPRRVRALAAGRAGCARGCRRAGQLARRTPSPGECGPRQTARCLGAGFGECDRAVARSRRATTAAPGHRAQFRHRHPAASGALGGGVRPSGSGARDGGWRGGGRGRPARMAR